WARAPLPPATEYDGVGLVWYRSAETRAAHVDDADRAVMARDELETFDRPVRDANFLAREMVLAPPPASGFTLFRFLFAASGVDGDTVARCLEGRRAALLSRALGDGGGGYLLNRASADV